MDTQSTTSVTQSLYTQASAWWDATIAVIGNAAQGVVVGWNALPQNSQLLVAGIGILLFLLAVRSIFRIRKLVRVNRAMAATLDDPFYRDITVESYPNSKRV